METVRIIDEGDHTHNACEEAGERCAPHTEPLLPKAVHFRHEESANPSEEGGESYGTP